MSEESKAIKKAPTNGVKKPVFKKFKKIDGISKGSQGKGKFASKVAHKVQQDDKKSRFKPKVKFTRRTKHKPNFKQRQRMKALKAQGIDPASITHVIKDKKSTPTKRKSEGGDGKEPKKPRPSVPKMPSQHKKEEKGAAQPEKSSAKQKISKKNR